MNTVRDGRVASSVSVFDTGRLFEPIASDPR